MMGHVHEFKYESHETLASEPSTPGLSFPRQMPTTEIPDFEWSLEALNLKVFVLQKKKLYLERKRLP